MIKIDRQNPQIARKSVDNAIDTLVCSNFSTLIYPEGTRSISGELLPFKKGGFILAIRSHLPVVPVTILGAGEALPKGKFNITKRRITVIIDKPILTAGMEINDKKKLLLKCRAVILHNLNHTNHNQNVKYKLHSA
jgi:1-acyl-sn-glycerol-3-phosphate acyltransferase